MPAMAEVRTIRVGEAQWHLVDQGAGPVVLLVHGFPLDHTMWRPQIEALGGQYRVIAPDLPGFGRNPPVDGTLTMEHLADSLAALLDALGIDEKICLCGLSMGGYVAFRFWHRHAGRVRALVLCDTRSAADSDEAAANRHKLAETVLADGSGPVAELMLPKLLWEASVHNQPALAEQLSATMRTAAPTTLAAALRGMAQRPDSRELLATFDVPTLVIVGQHDAISTVEEMREIATAIAGAEFAVIPDAGHMAPLENPAAVHAALIPFLDRAMGQH